MEIFKRTEHWQAVDDDRNVARDYWIVTTRDLFGWYVVERRWGRIGTAGRSATNSFADEGAALRFIATIRSRRSSARRRIGVSYRPA
jgi:predicted DNA-binding WGR domain protein